MNAAGTSVVGVLASFTGAIAYGINIPAARIAAQGGVNGANIALQRGALLVLILGVLLSLRSKPITIPQGQRIKIILMGLLVGMTGVGYLSALSFMPVALVVAIFYTFPLILILISPLAGSGPITLTRLLAFVIAFCGILLCVGPDMASLDWRGVALALLASFSCAGVFQVTSRIRNCDALTLMFWVQLFAHVFIVPAALFSGLSSWAAINLNTVPIVLSAIGFYIGFACQLLAGRLLLPATIGLIFLVEPVVAIVSATFFLGEQLVPLQMAGIGLVVGGLAFDAWRQRVATVEGRAEQSA